MIATSVVDQLAMRAQTEHIGRVVVGAIITGSGSVLLHHIGMEWELPSGPVGYGETLTEALIRMVEQVTGLSVVDVGEYVGSFDSDDEAGRCRHINFAVSVAATRSHIVVDRSAFGWFSLDGALPAPYPVREVIRKFRNIRYVAG